MKDYPPSGVERGMWIAALIVSVVLCLNFGLRYSLTEGVWFDEALTTYFIGLDWGNLFHFMSRYEANMGLYYVLLKLWSTLTGSELGLRLFSLVFYAGALWLMFLPLRRHFGYRAGMAFLVLALCHFFLARYSVEIRGYALALFFMALLWFSWTRIVLDGLPKYWLLYAVTGIFAVHSHFFIALGIFCLGIMALPAMRGRNDVFRWLGAHGVIALSFLPILAFVVFKESGQLAWLGSPNLKSLYYLAFDFSGAAPQAPDLIRFGLLLIVGGLVFLGLVSLELPEFREPLPGNPQLQLWLAAMVMAIVPVGVVFMVSQIEPIFSGRFFTPFMPFYLMLASIGLVLVFKGRSLVPGVIVLAAMAVSAHAYTQREPNRWAGAYQYLADHCSAGQAALYVTPRGQAAIDFYEKQVPTGCHLEPLPFRLAPENYFATPEEYPGELKDIDRYTTLWIVLTHLTEQDNEQLEQYREQIESTVGGCHPAYSNIAVEVLRCGEPGETEAMSTP